MSVKLAFIAFTILTLWTRAFGQCSGCPSGQSGDVQVVRVPLNNATGPQVLACFDASTNFEIDLTNWTGWADHDGEWVLHIYACRSTGLPTHSIGSVEVLGAPTGLASLAILVAGPTWSWVEADDVSITSVGCVNFGGLTIEDASVRAKTRVSIAVSGDITSGDPDEPAVIHANQIVRIQANGVTTGTGEAATVTGGTIDALITADGGDTFGANTTSIGHIRAWNAIRGQVHAVHKDIFTLRVTGVANASRAPQGLQADVLADDGHIFTVWTSAPITATADGPSKLWAAYGIGQVRTITEAGTLVSDVDAEVDLRAGMAFYTYDANAEYTPDDGKLAGMYVTGDLRGSITALNLNPGPGAPGGFTMANGRGGIFVEGECIATINILLNVFSADIVARGFGDTVNVAINVGWAMKGSIIAYGGAFPCTPIPPSVTCLCPDGDEFPDGGVINGLRIGPGPWRDLEGTEEVEIDVFAPEAWKAAYMDGFAAVATEPIDMTPYKFSGGVVVPRDGVEIFLTDVRTSSAPDGFALDSVIRARQISKGCKISRMSQVFGLEDELPRTKPRVEVRSAGGFEVTNMDAGVVWSGLLNWDCAGGNTVMPTLADRDVDNFASLPNMRIGCVSPTADVWWEMLGGDAASIGDVYGELHLRMDGDTTLVIDGKLGAIEPPTALGMGDEACGKFDNSWQAVATPVSEYSPRRLSLRTVTSNPLVTAVEPAIAKRAAIRVHDRPSPFARRLQGQIIVHGDSTGLPLEPLVWQKGELRVFAGEPESVHMVIALDTEDTDWAGPDYRLLYGKLGDPSYGTVGAYGLAPFALDDVKCFPPGMGAPGLGVPIAAVNVPNSQVLRLEFYGPVKPSVLGSTTYFVIERKGPSGWADSTGDFDVLAAARIV